MYGLRTRNPERLTISGVDSNILPNVFVNYFKEHIIIYEVARSAKLTLDPTYHVGDVHPPVSINDGIWRCGGRKHE